MSIQTKTEFISEHRFKHIDYTTNLNCETPKYPQNMLKNTLRNYKHIIKLSTIAIGTIGLVLTSQSKKAEAATNENIFNRFLSRSSQTVLNWENNLMRKGTSSTLKQNPLSTPDIRQNIHKNLLSKLLVTEMGESVKTEQSSQFSNPLTTNNSYNQNLSLVKQPNWSSSTKELSNYQSLIFSETESKEYVFQIPSFEQTELNSASSDNKNTFKQAHIVKPGDTLNEIASRHGISRQKLVKHNNIRNPHLIFVSQRIEIPQTKGKESLQLTEQSKSLASKDNETTILAQNKNQRDSLPKKNFSPQLSGLDNSEMENYDDIATNPLGKTFTLGTTVTPELPPLSSPERYLPAPSPAAEFDGYIWPARGTLTSGYGWRWGRPHRGIDIAAPIGTPIVAAASGEVISAGWNSGGYGNLVKLKHPNGSVTFYAHNHRIMVRRGQKVKQGQQIAQMGSTGYSTGSHLHFEIRSNGKNAVNPIAYLPKK